MEKENFISVKKCLSEYTYIYIFGRFHDERIKKCWATSKKKVKYKFLFQLKINTLYPISVYECKITGKMEVKYIDNWHKIEGGRPSRTGVSGHQNRFRLKVLRFNISIDSNINSNLLIEFL